jgi:two-component system sensor histidine kinase CiaH
MIENMFHSAALKLTVWYLAIIMFLSIGCSLALYRVYSNDLYSNAQRQLGYVDRSLPDSFPGYRQFKDRLLDVDLGHLKANLVVFNLGVLIVGGAISYALARRTLQPIEEAMEGQKRFTGDASHELRTPLAVIQTENEVALRDPSLSKKQAVDLLKSNLEEVGKLKALSDGLLRLASADNQQEEFQSVSLKKVASQAIERWQKAATDKAMKISTDLKNVSVMGDHDSLIDLVSILLDNAIKYSPEKTQIKVETGAKDKSAWIKITDQGPGIKASELPHIFERFYRADQARTKSGTNGYGLGLAIAKKIAETHGGSLEVSSTLGQGSVFTVRLPKV